MPLISSSNHNTSSDHALTSFASFSFSFEFWMAILEKDSLSDQDQAFFLQDLEDHPEWMNRTNQRQQTPLIIAAEHGHVKMVQSLIQSGADLNLQEGDGWTALMLASDWGCVEVVKVLIQSGAYVNVQNQDGWTALMCASYQGYTDVVKFLIQNGSDLNVQNKAGWTALMKASDQGHVEVVRELINYGANQEVYNHEHETAEDLAKKREHHEVMSLLEAYEMRQVLNQEVNPMDNSSSLLPLKEIDSRQDSKGFRL